MLSSSEENIGKDGAPVNRKVNVISARRIQRELDEISRDPPPNCSAGPKADNLYEWTSTIIGPTDSVYEGGND